MTKVCNDLNVNSNGNGTWTRTKNLESMHCAPGQYMNFNSWYLRLSLVFEPYLGTRPLWHRGRQFKLRRKDDELTFSCFGRSTEPIKQLIKDCREWTLAQRANKTVVCRPDKAEKDERRKWIYATYRHSRPVETVVLAAGEIKKVLDDVSNYLRLETFKWYERRGIPCRRRFLFSGPPGTAKTSLAFAIAGVFGLKTYCISLVEPTLTEEDLSMLFNRLPRQCVVLLEDIDAAGLWTRKTAKSAGSESPSTYVSSDCSDLGVRDSELTDTGSDKCQKSKRNGISLSGLLNASGGIASHEGRVLIITTNHPEKLDPALIRPGRVDMHIAFPLASCEQIEQLFMRMYALGAEQDG